MKFEMPVAKSRWILATLALGASAALGCAGAAGATQADVTAGKNASATGGYLYEKQCASCHGDRGAGGGRAPAVLGRRLLESRYATAQQLFDYVANEMPPDRPGGLEIDQYWHVVTFMVGTTGKKMPEGRLSESNASDIKLHD